MTYAVQYGEKDLGRHVRGSARRVVQEVPYVADVGEARYLVQSYAGKGQYLRPHVRECELEGIDDVLGRLFQQHRCPMVPDYRANNPASFVVTGLSGGDRTIPVQDSKMLGSFVAFPRGVVTIGSSPFEVMRVPAALDGPSLRSHGISSASLLEPLLGPWVRLVYHILTYRIPSILIWRIYPTSKMVDIGNQICLFCIPYHCFCYGIFSP